MPAVSFWAKKFRKSVVQGHPNIALVLNDPNEVQIRGTSFDSHKSLARAHSG